MSGWAVLLCILLLGPFALLISGVREKLFGANSAAGGMK
ncbi:hypothetical protein SAMN05444287_1732 [Octadecabacter temperatus]|uniref:Uncharacterized protein n=1 Tax=Octadecabacter temperatus TaxID=1458307 RepID=A0A0K0Y6S1_9RHOB|nr:hypothetical protein OSB_20760 [Octadecabacter temperatus]SIO17807.1 hypothetical protein SAMN05444287_1732 [Octadecabacter temperatus]